MPLVKVLRRNLAPACGTTQYNIGHIVTGSLSFAQTTDIFIDDETYQGPGIYTLFTGFSSAGGVGNLNIVGRSVCENVKVLGNSIVVTLN